ncbi:MAG: heme exporter protein CcmD [Rhodospirillales bacterium]|nr:heme exporter protein CcmD [Rhodospirillales bacterium]
MEAGALSAFLAMGGYAAYVWPAFAVTAVVLIGLLVASVRSVRCREADLARLRAELREKSEDPTGEA